MQRPAVADYPAGATTPSRVITDFELVWMLRGRARLLAAEELTLVPGQLLLIPPGVAHEIEWDRTQSCRHGYVHFGPEYLDHQQVTAPQRRPMTDDDPLSGTCAYLVWLGQLTGEAWRAPASAALRFALEVFVTGPLPIVDGPDMLPPPLASAVAFLAHQWTRLPLRRIDVAELAEAASISRGYLNRLFGLAFGRPPAVLLERARFSRAEAMLARTQLTIEVIAYQCGFADPSHFSHRFRTLYAMSPRAYRSSTGDTHSVLDDAGTRRLIHHLWGQVRMTSVAM